jgi:serine/threonine protein phosphatase PrpC
MISCPRCAAPCPDESNYCEECGAALPQPAGANSEQGKSLPVSGSSDLRSCSSCGAKLEPDTQFCPQCGIAVSCPDSYEIAELPDLVALSNHGLRHPKNEDAVLVKRLGSRTFLALSDGVSHSQRPELAAHRAISAAVTVFMESPERPAEDLLREAVARAQAAVGEIPFDPNLLEAPACATLTVALVNGKEITVAWLGDTRAYFITRESARLLTRDHSILNRLLSEAHLTESEALLLPGSHALTRAVGGGAGTLDPPDITTYPINEPGLLLLCSDGLWNYAPEPAALYDLVRSHTSIPPKTASLLPLAKGLVQYACNQGGADNISVALTTIGPTPGRIEK